VESDALGGSCFWEDSDGLEQIQNEVGRGEGPVDGAFAEAFDGAEGAFAEDFGSGGGAVVRAPKGR